MQNEQQTILVVEDDQSLLLAIQGKVQRNGFKAVTARTVEQALNHLAKTSGINAIWLDHYLIGEENGIDLVMKIKQSNSPWKNIPVFVISNTVGPDKVEAYLRLGAVKYYTKAEKRLDEIVEDIKTHIQGVKISN